jgi:GH25 family lysozyme M1 (1,4-beta-N-acetylmuramidase)
MICPAEVNRSTTAAQSRGSVKVFIQPLKALTGYRVAVMVQDYVYSRNRVLSGV